MILSLIVGALAGYGAQFVETQVTEALFRLLGQENMIADQDRGAAALLATLLVGAVVLTVLGYGSVLMFIVGAGLGYFQHELRELLLSKGR